MFGGCVELSECVQLIELKSVVSVPDYTGVKLKFSFKPLCVCVYVYMRERETLRDLRLI